MALPDGWILRVSRSKGKVFYYNTFTRETRWSRPMGEPIPAQSLEVREAPPAPERKKRKWEVESSDDSYSAINRRAAIARCMRVGASSGGKAFSPWDHQVDAVDKLLEALAHPSHEPRANRFLLQHSTGSGKTVTIGALAHQLLNFHDASSQRFHTVVLMIDRIKLDEQVGDYVERFLRRNGVDSVYRASSIEHLATLLSPQETVRQRVIITTVQKIGLLAKNAVLLTRLLHGNADDSDDGFSRIAIITDEAHRSHSASTRQTIETVMEAGEGATGGRNATFVGFTATPNVEALRLFGSTSTSRDGGWGPFHCYTMSSAVADGLIVNVLQGYVSVRCCLEVSVPDDVQRELVRCNLMRAVMDAASDDVAVLKAKSAFVMADYVKVKAGWGRAKCMIVTRSRRDVVRYHELVSAFVANKRLSWRVFAVFSGSVNIATRPSNSVTEQSLNPKHSSLASSDIVIVCDKLDTGYSDPLLACMYIDRHLRSSVQTVQLLSRLNRRHPDKKRVRIVDFANHAAQIRRHFAAFWQQARAKEEEGEVMPMADWRTMVSIVSTCIPPWEIQLDNRDEVSQQVAALVQTLDRDAFEQLAEGLRLGAAAWNVIECSKLRDAAEASSPIRHNHVVLLKKLVEKAQLPNEHALFDADEIVSKMKTRIQRYEIQYDSGLDPAQLLASGESTLTTDALGKFEAYLELLTKATRSTDQRKRDALFLDATIIQPTAIDPTSENNRFQELLGTLFTKICELLQ